MFVNPLCIVFVSAVLTDAANAYTLEDCSLDIHELKEQIKSLRQQNNNMMNMIKSSQTTKMERGADKRLLVSSAFANNASLSGVVAFSVGLQHTIYLGQDQIVEFDKVFINIGNGFEPRHSHFTAPVKGLYLFSGSLFVQDAYVHVDIVKNGKSIAYMYAHTHAQSTGTTVALLEAGDMVWMKHRAETSNSPIYGASYEQFNTFTGVLIQQIEE